MKPPKEPARTRSGTPGSPAHENAEHGVGHPLPAPARDTTSEPVLGTDVLAWLDHAVAPEPPDMAMQARVKRRLLRRIAAESTPRHLTVPAAAGDWQPFAAGVSIKVLHQQGEVMSYLLRLQPGASLPPHRHPLDEECLVLEGEMHIGAVVVGQGGYHLGRRGVLHDTLTSPGGALIFLRGAVPELALSL